MLRHLFLVASCVALSAGAGEPARAPVLVELFTSEGCSSCPPADRLLEQLDPQTIVLSEHVDYWDHEGWKDRFSSHAFTERQESYSRLFHIDGPYTPEMVVDGAAEFVGSDARQAKQEIEKAARRQKVELHLARTAAGVRVETSTAPNAGDVMLALVDDSDASQVTGGENKGHALRHVAVVRSLRKIPLPPDAARQRVVVFLQESGQGRVSAAAMLPVYNPAP